VSGPVPFVVTAKKLDDHAERPAWPGPSVSASESSASPVASDVTVISPVATSSATVDSAKRASRNPTRSPTVVPSVPYTNVATTGVPSASVPDTWIRSPDA
jgi:hypothetical protein